MDPHYLHPHHRSVICSVPRLSHFRRVPRLPTSIHEMTRFRPCIDLHAGSVKQIVGGTLSTTSESSLKTNFTSEHPSAYYADLYKKHQLGGAHVIMLGPGNETAAQEALQAWPGGMQVGGGITETNAKEWIEKGAEKVSLPYLTLHCRWYSTLQFGTSSAKLIGIAVGDNHIVSLSQQHLLAGAPPISPPCTRQ
jgi:phosphoribosylformimino-5-aminoimidazole carboxamide ribotide isomerase